VLRHRRRSDTHLCGARCSDTDLCHGAQTPTSAALTRKEIGVRKEIGPGRPGGLLPPFAPTDPGLPNQGGRLVTSGHSASLGSIRGHRVNTGGGPMPSACFPPTVPRRGTPFPPRGPGGAVPPTHRYYGVLRLPAAHLAALRFRGGCPSTTQPLAQGERHLPGDC
jgi:hypothetical protein